MATNTAAISVSRAGKRSLRSIQTSTDRRSERLPGALGAHDQFAELACRAFAAACLGHAVSVVAHEGVGAGDRHAQADAADHRQIRQVVTEIGHFRVAQPEFGQQLVENHQLVFAPLIQVLDAEGSARGARPLASCAH